MQELSAKEVTKDCNYCTERNTRIEKYEEDIEKEKMRECLKAFEREKIAKGLQTTKSDEKVLKEMQKEQIQEKKNIEQCQAEVDQMWHRVLLEDVRLKEEHDRLKEERLKQEMIERRLAYDEQIYSANRKRREVLQREREIENRRLERMKKKMEQDYYDAIKRKKDQQMENKTNHLERFNMKVSRLKNEKQREQDCDRSNIHTAMEALRDERQKKLEKIQFMKKENQIFVENYERERRMAKDMEREAERVASKLKEQEEKKSDDVIINIKVGRRNAKIKAAEDYKIYLEELNRKRNKKEQERRETMASVKETAYNELRKKLEDANDELKKQAEYRNILSNQIQDNQIIMELESNLLEVKERPFVKKAITFKDLMKDKAAFGTKCENPVHPFKRMIQKQLQDQTRTSLPFIKKTV